MNEETFVRIVFFQIALLFFFLIIGLFNILKRIRKLESMHRVKHLEKEGK